MQVSKRKVSYDSRLRRCSVWRTTAIVSSETAPCTCAHDRVDPKLGWLSALAPALACAVCPACLSTYAKIAASLGTGLALSETAHLVLLLVAVGLSLAVSAWRTWKSRRAWPIAVALVGGATLVVGHLAEIAALEWLGIGVLLVGGLVEHLRLVRSRHAHRHAHAHGHAHHESVTA